MTPENEVKKAVDEAGGAAVVAKFFGIHPVSVYEWIEKGRVPADRAPDLEKLCNGAVLCEVLAPGTNWQYLRSTHAETEKVSL
ncbi:hypothetical protein LT85_1002 [Collimonas arenae]|uniref:YdaS antitoxin of YdaST toxin-antitoxin system n=1 Tax=Collimonas arenae TaxID=279058 RepID=A0A0A1F8R8_9BURK|nr:Cro/CI family transcriptional regulator [Collimonas arenae]AIY40160.1 hypothetical protein LT85_1002 [Collimonas arenae]